ncbi:MAG: trans-sulfuration enzyme family protein [Ilumatobacteraceae bacterium]
MNEQSKETTAITAGRDGSGSLAPALWPSTTWQSAGLDESNTAATAVHETGNYGRYANPTVREFEKAVAALEGAEDALASGSGMGALATAIFALCSTGDHIVAQKQLYGGTLALLNGPCKRMGIDVTFVDANVPGSLAAAVQRGKTMLVIAETPSNPQLALTSLDELGAIKGPYTLVDSTLATPLGQSPLRHGVSLVMHSATKGIAGHNDAMLGVLAGEKDLIDAIWGYSVLHGATASPADALNGLRGIRTLGVRFARQCDTALAIARTLQSRRGVTAVNYPGLESHPQHGLAKDQMRAFGSVLSFEVDGGIDRARSVLSNLRIVRPAVSLGGPETIISHPATSTHVSMTADDQRAAGISDGLLRLSVGLEDQNDVIEDLQHALQ